MLCMVLYIYGEWNLADTSDAEDEELAKPSAARLLLYSYVQRKVNVQNNTTQYLERMWVACALYELMIAFDYCFVHISTVIRHVSQQFRFLVFFIVTVRMNFMHFVIAMGCVSAVELFL
ncbi:hypothetical protein Tsp_05757 [Trichinella spiralis]|uniref:hypothetical protein n=1 Tax=Trichinella spiralis TaxID=6334 RepID=UPI0001EFBFB4|nr:hypothetical protein Tsp_05757 [Trichinella spiralis]